jgi:ADP-ribose pyrophosphatase YjhB (NUDIX family)
VGIDIGMRASPVRLQAIMAQFKELKKGTPTYGAILLNRGLDKVLLVQFMGKCADSGPWSFPRGKLEHKDHVDILACAAREVRRHAHHEMELAVSCALTLLVQGCPNTQSLAAVLRVWTFCLSCLDKQNVQAATTNLLRSQQVLAAAIF